ncbi:hypothetical protein BGX26_010149 [Mortierella sp. AD094]|nr:hypothetical protein BGX26_010149 [Mortierella sp. AD094]
MSSQRRQRILQLSLAHPNGSKPIDPPISLSGALMLSLHHIISSPNACGIPFGSPTARKADALYNQLSASMPQVLASSNLNTKGVTLTASKVKDGGTHSAQSPAISNFTVEGKVSDIPGAGNPATHKTKPSANPPQLPTTSSIKEPPVRKFKKPVISQLRRDVNSNDGSGRKSEVNNDHPGVLQEPSPQVVSNVKRSYAQVAAIIQQPPLQEVSNSPPLCPQEDPSTKQTYLQAFLNGLQQTDQVPLGDVDTAFPKKGFSSNSTQQRPIPLCGSYAQATPGRLSKPTQNNHNNFAINEPPRKLDRNVFLRYAEDTTSIPRDILHSIDGEHFIIRDLYPKSTFHFLVLPLQIVKKLGDLRANKEASYYKSLRDGSLKCNQCDRVFRRKDDWKFSGHLKNHLDEREELFNLKDNEHDHAKPDNYTGVMTSSTAFYDSVYRSYKR